MSKSIKVLAMLGLFGLAACGGQQEEEYVVVDPEPITTEPVYTGKYINTLVFGREATVGRSASSAETQGTPGSISGPMRRAEVPSAATTAPESRHRPR
ncbi:putative lipoprotein [Citreicella sp. SE45]|nr:putative lipoprotein [Citreicella sp. SE45]